MSAPARSDAHLSIRPATATDLPRVAALFEALHRFNATFDAAFALDDDWYPHLAAAFARGQDDPNALWVLAWDGDEAVGLLVGERHDESPLFRRRHWVELSALYVQSSHRRYGVAGRLVARLEEWVRERGQDTVQLYVSAANVEAQGFYARQGYEPIQEIWRKRLGDRATAPPSDASADS